MRVDAQTIYRIPAAGPEDPTAGLRIRSFPDRERAALDRLPDRTDGAEGRPRLSRASAELGARLVDVRLHDRLALVGHRGGMGLASQATDVVLGGRDGLVDVPSPETRRPSPCFVSSRLITALGSSAIRSSPRSLRADR